MTITAQGPSPQTPPQNRRSGDQQLRHRHAAGKARTAPTIPSDAPPQSDAESASDVVYREKVAEHRQRQKSVASILEQTLGKTAECHTELRTRRAFLMLVGLVYDRLALHAEVISTGELTALARALVENGRFEVGLQMARQLEAADEGPDDGSTVPPLERVADSIRQVYGLAISSTTGISSGEDADTSRVVAAVEASPTRTESTGGAGG